MKVKILLMFLLILFLSDLVLAIGVRPAIVPLNFVPDKEHKLVFQPILDSGGKVEVSVEGELKEYAVLDKKMAGHGEAVTLTIKFPKKIDKPGYYYLYLVFTESISASGAEMVGSLAKVRAPVKVFVPFEGKYVEPELEVPNGNVNEIISVKLKLISRGTEEAFVSPKILFSDFAGKKMDSIVFEPFSLASFSQKDLSQMLDTHGWKPGAYYAETDIAYDGPRINANATFNIGSLFVNVTNYTREIVKGGIQRYFISIRNGWNGELGEVFADVNVSGAGGEIVFRTPSVSLAAWTDAKLEGFIDTTGLELGSYKAEIVLYYSGKNTIVNGELKVVKKKTYILTVVISIALIIIITGVIILWRRLKNAQRTKKPGRQ